MDRPNLSTFRRMSEIPVEIAGARVMAYPLTAAETGAIFAAMPPPRAPMVADPTKGSLAPRVPDTHDPAYRSRALAHGLRIDAAELAWSIRYRTESGRTPPEIAALLADGADAAEVARPYCVDAACELMAALPESEIRAALAMIRPVYDSRDLRETAEGN